MNCRILVLAVAVLASASVPAAGGGEYDHADTNINDQAAVQRGAAMFVNYCMGCHQAEHMRYRRMGRDLNLDEEQIRENLVFGDREVADYITNAMDPEDAEEWFGILPPDLTLVARSRGTDWLYTYLRSFYLTDSGWNNTVLENPAMPHVLWQLQGIQRAVIETETGADGEEHEYIAGLELEREGLMSVEEYDAAVLDLVTFLEYMAEPAALERERIGIWVLLFLAVFTFLAYLLYQEYWKDVK